jgi:ABC-type nitrate/sulfonate/bicarbonate transport system substrate-binding protein
VDIQAAWKKATGQANYPMTALIVDAAWAAKNRAAMTAILSAYKASVTWVNAHPADAGKLVDTMDIGIKGAVAAAAIPLSHYTFLTAGQARPAIEALFNAEESTAIGGALPGDSFYYK